MKKSVLPLFLALLAGSAFAQTGTTAAAPAAANAAQPADPVIISGGGVEIHRSEFESALQSLPAQYQQYVQGPGKKQFAEDFLRMKLLAVEGKKAGLEQDPQVLRELASIRDNLVAKAQMQKLEQSVTVSDDDLKKAYEAHKTEFEQAKVHHILIAFKGSPAAQPGKPELTEEQAKAKAEDLLAQLKKGGSFEDLAKKESDDVGSAQRGGDLGGFGRGQMVPEFEQAAFSQQVGDPAIVRSEFGYHIVRVDSRETVPFEQARASLERNERNTKLQNLTAKLVEDSKPTFDSSYFNAPAPQALPAPQPTPPAGNP